MPKRLCHEIVIDHQAGEVRLDGLAFPYHVGDAVTITGTGDLEIPTVSLDVFAANVTVIHLDGRRTTPAIARHETELAWARDEGRRIVRRGLADVDPEQARARESAPIFETLESERA